jgi:hypothetical protein
MADLEGSKNATGTNMQGDEAELARMGYKQELRGAL